MFLMMPRVVVCLLLQEPSESSRNESVIRLRFSALTGDSAEKSTAAFDKSLAEDQLA